MIRFAPTGGPDNERAVLHDGEAIDLIWTTPKGFWTNGDLVFFKVTTVPTHYERLNAKPHGKVRF